MNVTGPRRLSTLILLVAMGWAVFVLPKGLVVLSPGPVFNAGEVISVSGYPTPGTGKLIITTVAVQFPDFPAVVRAIVDPRQELALKDSVIPSGMSVTEFEERARGQMAQAQHDALEAARTYLAGWGGVAPGVSDRDVAFRVADVGGPSAGLAMALQIVCDLTGQDLAGGRVVAVTGAITPAGDVTAVGGVALKVRAAREAGATLMLVPASEEPEAARLAGGMKVIGVRSLAQAVAVLRASGRIPPATAVSNAVLSACVQVLPMVV